MSPRSWLVGGAALALALGLACALGACAAKRGSDDGGQGASVPVGGGGGVAGGGGSGGTLSSTGGSGGTTTSGGGAGGSGPCVGCKDRMGHADAVVCAGTSTELWEAYDGCTCQEGGKCTGVCTDTLCQGQAWSYDCQQCLYNGPAGCLSEYNDCLNDD